MDTAWAVNIQNAIQHATRKSEGLKKLVSWLGSVVANYTLYTNSSHSLIYPLASLVPGYLLLV